MTMSDALQFLKDEAARNQRISEFANTAKRRKALQYRAKHLQRAAAKIEQLQEALRALLEDTQHSDHNCGDPDCPVDAARQLLPEQSSGPPSLARTIDEGSARADRLLEIYPALKQSESEKD